MTDTEPPAPARCRLLQSTLWHIFSSGPLFYPLDIQLALPSLQYELPFLPFYTFMEEKRKQNERFRTNDDIADA